MSLSIAQALQQAARLSSDTARLDTALLLAHVLGVERSYLLTWPERTLDTPQQQAFETLMQRRQAGEPIAYLLGHQAFWTLDLQVTPATLIPRPETELLVELCLQLALPEFTLALDLGTGSGAIALALAYERPLWQVSACDQSAEALVVAQANAQRNGVANVRFYQSDWYSALAGTRYHVILSNPPYIDPKDAHLRQGDLRFEPRSALAADENGYADLAKIIQSAPDHLEGEGWLLVEHGYAQGERVRALLTQRGFAAVRSERDLNGHERVTLGIWRDLS